VIVENVFDNETTFTEAPGRVKPEKSKREFSEALTGRNKITLERNPLRFIARETLLNEGEELAEIATPA